jgi:hypothetical protein
MGQPKSESDQAEITQVLTREEVRINLNEGAENGLGHDFSAHRSVHEEAQVFRGPFRNLLGGVDAERFLLFSEAMVGCSDYASDCEQQGDTLSAVTRFHAG